VKIGNSLLLVSIAASAVGAQTAHISPDSAFIVAAKRGAVKYESQSTAIAEGFRPVGVEFPAMGVHWVSLPRVIADTVDPAQPSVLIYVTVNGKPRLAGVAFTDLLAPGERLGRSPGAGYWHEHNGSVTEESLPLHHVMGPSANEDNDHDLRLAILHVWTTMPNPAGAFVTDNWSLPTRRLDRVVRPLSPDAARAASVAQDETGYYALMLRTSLGLSDEETSIADSLIAQARAGARVRLAKFKAAKSDSSAATSAEATLAESWEDLWRSLDRGLPKHRQALRELRARL
jgi:hypothetical protein